MKKLIELEIFFTTGDNIKIPVKYLKDCWISGIKKDLSYLTDLEDNTGKIYEGEDAKKFKIPVLKEFLNNRNDFSPYDEDMDIVENMTNLERIKNYNNLVGFTLRYDDRTERTLGIDWREDTKMTLTEDKNNIITIEIK